MKPLRTGTVLADRYEIGTHLGTGGFALTYLAHDLTDDRSILVLKEFVPQFQDGECRRTDDQSVEAPQQHQAEFESMRARMAQEALRIAGIPNPGVVKVLGQFEENGTTYIALEHVAGRPVKDLIGTPWESVRVRRFVAELCAIVADIHATGIIHCDLTPGNVMMVQNSPVVIDFGLAREVKDSISLEAGTPGYAAPEQWGTIDDRVGPWTDVFAIATLAGVLLTGAEPQELHVALAVPTVDPELAKVIRRGRSHLPADRPESVQRFAQEFRQGAPPEPTRITKRHQRRARPTERKPFPAKTFGIILALAAVLLVLAGLASALLDWNHDRNERQASGDPSGADSGDERADVVPASVVHGRPMELPESPLSTTYMIWPRYFISDPYGRLWISDPGNHRVVTVDLDKTARTAAGDGIPYRTGEAAPEGTVRLAEPAGITFANDLAIFADTAKDRLYSIDDEGDVAVFAGTGRRGSTGDGGPARDARLSAPTALASDLDGNVYVVEGNGARIRRIDADGVVTTVIDEQTKVIDREGEAGKGPKVLSEAGRIEHLFAYSDGTLVLASDDLILIFTSEGVLERFAGSLEDDAPWAKDKIAKGKANLAIKGISSGADGDIFVIDANTGSLLRIREGALRTVHMAVESERKATSLELWSASGLWYLADGKLLTNLAFRDAASLRELDTVRFRATEIGGDADRRGASDEPTDETPLPLSQPSEMALQPDGTVLLLDGVKLRSLHPDGSTSWQPLVNPDEGADDYYIFPSAIALGPNDEIYISSSYSNRVFQFGKGELVPVAGSGTAGFAGDGSSAVDAQLSNPQGLAVDSSGDLVISDYGNNRIRKVSMSEGTITTIAGNGETEYDGEGKDATESSLLGPTSLVYAPDDTLYINDQGHDRIRRVTRFGVMEKVAGGGDQPLPAPTTGSEGTRATSLALPNVVAMDLTNGGDLVLVANDLRNSVIRISNGTAYTLTSNPGGSFDGAGDRAALELADPAGVLSLEDGTILIADNGNRRVVAIGPDLP